MKHALITTAAAALLLASQGAYAQPQNREGPGAGAQTPGPGASPGSGMGPGNSGEAPGRSGPSAGPSGPPTHAPGPGANPGRGNSANAPAQHGPASTPRAEQQPQRPAQQHAQPQGQQQKTQQKAEQKNEQKGEPQRTGESKQPTTTPRADAQGKTTGKDADQNRTARDGKADGKADAKDTARKDADRSKDQNRNDTAQGKSDDKPGDKSADKGHSDRMAGSQDLRQARERLDTQERVRLHEAFDRRSAKTNIRVNVNIGSRVPRNVHLVRVPQTVISFFPYYRDYSYFVVDERVYIVNPRSYEVVDIIDEGYGRGRPVQQHASLSLSDRQIVIVREAVADADIRPESLRLRLALGAEIPRDVELHRFPARVLDNVRELESYRFVLVEDQIVIVKPADRSIALVIDRS